MVDEILKFWSSLWRRYKLWNVYEVIISNIDAIKKRFMLIKQSTRIEYEI